MAEPPAVEVEVRAVFANGEAKDALLRILDAIVSARGAGRMLDPAELEEDATIAARGIEVERTGRHG